MPDAPSFKASKWKRSYSTSPKGCEINEVVFAVWYLVLKDPKSSVNDVPAPPAPASIEAEPDRIPTAAAETLYSIRANSSSTGKSA